MQEKALAAVGVDLVGSLLYSIVSSAALRYPMRLQILERI